MRAFGHLAYNSNAIFTKSQKFRSKKKKKKKKRFTIDHFISQNDKERL